MSASLARLFCSLFNTIMVLLALALLIGVGLYYLTTGYGLTASVVLFAGLAGLVALFGSVALQIENNGLLHRIADALEGQGAADQAPRPRIGTEPAAAVAAAMAAGRVMPGRAADPVMRPAETGLRAAALAANSRLVAETRRPAGPQGRVEPVLRSR